MIWALALPAMLTNIATALFGLADLWVIGRLGDAAAQGGVELGARFMTSLLVVFNFLRTGTTALSAQQAGALSAQQAGRGDAGEQAATLARAALLAGAIAALLLAAYPLIVPLGLEWLGAKGDLSVLAGAYIARRYGAVPAALINGALTGWLVGQRQVRGVLAAEVGANLVHIALDLTLVLGLHWGVQGVASASLISEWLKFAFLLTLAVRQGAWQGLHQHRALLGDLAPFRRLLALNRDLFLRTLLLTGVMLEFTRAGAKAGAVTLAANGILFQMFMLSALILDGFETAAQVLCGEAAGQGDAPAFRAAVRANLRWGLGLGLVITLVYAVAGADIASSFTLNPQVRAAATRIAPWAAALPVLGVASYVMDGVFVGAGWARAMLGTMAAAFLAFNAALWLAAPWGNIGLWLSFYILLIARAGGQLLCLPGLVRRRLAG
uniref:MATE family efflux transporter n=1 Tax=Novosphingobium terrae TaxID=2726189 RepID=UPI001F136AC4|nr:MATE family efflux transporter [Novosphingobium terrae]